MATITLTPQPGSPALRMPTVASGTITMATGASAVTDVIDKRGFGLVVIILPSLTSTTLSVEVSDTASGTFVPLYTRGGTQVSWASETGSKAYDVPELGSVLFFRLKTSVDQSTTKTIIVQGHV